MRTALELVPWLQASYSNKHKPPFDCEAFEDGCGRDEETKRRVHCGYVDHDSWIGDKPDLPEFVGDIANKRKRVDIKHLSICPGWLVRQPVVFESARAHLAMEKSCLGQMFPDGEAIVYDAAMILMSAYNRHSEPDGN